MTDEKALKFFLSIKKVIEDTNKKDLINGNYSLAINRAIIALSGKVANKPIEFMSDYADNKYLAYKCPICMSEEELYFKQQYCDYCGAKLDWRKEND